jgi:hypothetical protein
MSFVSSPALRRVAQLVGAGAAAALVITSLGAGSVAAATIESGAIDCIVPTANSKTVPLATVQKDPHNFSAEQIAVMEAKFQAARDALGTDVNLADIKDPIEIETYMHLVTKDKTVEGGNVPRKWLRAQMKYFNHSFRGHGHGAEGARTPFKFVLAGVDRTVNADWYEHSYPPEFGADSTEREMKTALREPSSTAETLNVYFTHLIAVGLLGYATFPEWYGDEPILDGVVVETQSLPGGSAAPYNLGGTVAHEVGHWVGLYHTFEGGCAGGDEVADTPPQASPTSGCPASADTCSEPGDDPIHNYMDYSDDECYNQFTIGQRERSLDQWFAFRDGVTQ